MWKLSTFANCKPEQCREIAHLCLLLQVNELVDAIDHALHKLHLGGTDAALVGDVELAVGTGRRVLTTATARLQTVTVSKLLELVHAKLLVELGQLEHHGGAQASADVTGAGGDVT